MKTTNTRSRLALLCSLAGFIGPIALASDAIQDAREALRARDYTRAATLLAPLTGETSRDAEAFHLLSRVRLADKNAAEAVALAEKATKLDPAKADYFVQLGYALGNRMREVSFLQQAMLAGKLKKAFERAVELNPNEAGALIGLSRYYSQAPEIAGGSLVKAKELALRARDIAPFPGEIELGTIAEQEEKFAEAFEHYAAAAAANPAHGWARHLCGRTLVKLGRTAEAREYFEVALQNDPALEASRAALAALDTADASREKQ